MFSTETTLPLSLLFTVLALCIVLAMAWLTIKFLSKIFRGRVAGGEIEIRSTYALGTRQHLYIVQYRNTDYFLGVTTDKIELLDSHHAKQNNEHDSEKRD